MKLWVAKDKDGTIHLSNYKPMKPKEVLKTETANDEIFWPFEKKDDLFFFVYNGEIEGLTFENSPKEVNITLK